MLQLHCPSGAPQAVMLLAVHPPFVRAAPVSFTQLHSFAPLSFHFTMFAANQFCSRAWLSCHPERSEGSFYINRKAQTLSQSLISSLGSIPLFRRSFISARFSPPAANIVMLAVPAIACVTGLYWHIATLMQACHIKPLHCAPITACRPFYCAPQSLALAGRIRSFVPHSLLQPLPARRKYSLLSSFIESIHLVKVHGFFNDMNLKSTIGILKY